MPERLMALKRMPYGRRMYEKGDCFLADYITARTLVLTGCCVPAPEGEAQVTKLPPVKVTQAEDPIVIERPGATIIIDLPKRKRGRPRKVREYERRDMVPEK